MKRAFPLAALAMGLLVPLSPLEASGDFGCDPSWQLGSRSFGSCGNSALLSPGNDSRVNLFLLLRDRQGTPAPRLSYPNSNLEDPGLGHNFFSWRLLRAAYFPQEGGEVYDNDHYGSRCISLASGNGAFSAALQANRSVPAAERERLTQARGTIAAGCASGTAKTSFAAPDVKSTAGREFLSYLQAADAFYGEQWEPARSGFTALRGSKDPWLSETATYMLARTELNAATATAFDEYGVFATEKVDKAALGRARAGLDAYLARYAQGRYAASARGLVRRTLWLAGDAAGLAREYERLLGVVPVTTPGAADLVEEIDNKLIIGNDGKVVDRPLLLATIDLMMMRQASEDEGAGANSVISAAQLAAQKDRFAGRDDLYGFVLANHAFYVEKSPAKVLRLIPDDARQPSYSALSFSRQVLRGMALMATRDRNEAGFWRELLGGAKALYQRPLVELALAMNYERSGRLADVFAPSSPILEAPIREILLQYVAGPDLLRAQARNAQRPQHERDVALFTLLQKQLAYGDYAGFVRDSALVPAGATREGGVWEFRLQERIPVGLFRAGRWSDGYPCPALAVTAAALARDPRDVKGRLCLGEFYRLNGFDEFDTGSPRPERDELGGTPTLFPGRAIPRGDFYRDIIADAKAPAGDKAYALYRAVNCYAPSGGNGCGGADVAEDQRRAWFQRLKRDYPASPWAQKLRYYW